MCVTVSIPFQNWKSAGPMCRSNRQTSRFRKKIWDAMVYLVNYDGAAEIYRAIIIDQA